MQPHFNVSLTYIKAPASFWDDLTVPPSGSDGRPQNEHKVSVEFVDFCGKQVGMSVHHTFHTVSSGGGGSAGEEDAAAALSVEMPVMIPNLVHFLFGLKADFGGKPFSLVHYLAVKSAYEVQRPTAIYVHYIHLPTGHWWEMVIIISHL